MTAMTKEQIEAWLRGEPGILEAKSQMEKHAPDLARTALALHQQLADAQAAQAMVVEQVEKAIKATMLRLGQHPDIKRIMAPQVMWGAGDSCITAIRDLADPSGVEALAALRAERDGAREALMNAGIGLHVAKREAAEAEAERDALAAKLAAAEARVGALMELVEVAGRARLIIDTAFLEMGETITYAPSTISEVCKMLEPHSALAAPAEETKG